MVVWTIVSLLWHKKWREMAGFGIYFEGLAVGLDMKNVGYCNTKHTPF